MILFPRRLLAAGAVACLVASAATAQTAPAAVDLIFYAPYLSKLSDGSTLTYKYVRTAANEKDLKPSFEDEVRVDIAPKDNPKGVTVNLFSGDREINNPNLSRSGNPVIIALMEQDVREMSKLLGGSPFYIKNRIMDSMRAAQAGEPVKIEFGGKTVDGWKFRLEPFAKDAHRAQLKDYAARTYELTFSDDVPGGLYALKSVVPRPDGQGPLLVEELTLKPDQKATAEATEKKQ